MTWQDPGGNPAPGGPGGPDEDATRADWDLAQLDALVGSGGGGAGSNAGQATDPGAVPPPPPAGPVPPLSAAEPPSGPPPAPGYGIPTPAPGGAYAPAPSPGYGGYPPTGTDPGMAWAPPPSYGVPTGPGGGLEYAGVGGRFVAWLLDGVLLNVLGAAISWILFLAIVGTGDWTTVFLNASSGTGGLDLDGGFFGRVFIVSVVVTFLTTGLNLAYFVLLWSSRRRATFGMRLLGLELGNAADGRTLDRAQAFKRWLAMGEWANIVALVPVIGGLIGLGQLLWYLVLLVTTANNPRRQGLHDQYAGTAVVQPAGKSNNGLIVGCLVLIVLVVIVVPLVSMVALVFLGGQVETILSTVGESI